MAEEKTENEIWLEKVNEEAALKAEELKEWLKCDVEAVVFVIAPGKEAAVGFLRKPDAKQGFKILRSMGEDYDTGVELIARSQLIRECNGNPVSDSRFMNVDGKYAPENSELNLSLLMRAATLIKPFSNQFKKK